MKLNKEVRTNKQNASLHVYCQELADLLNESGISQSVFYKNIEVDYTMESVKELWRTFARAKYGKTSTKDLDTTQIDAIYNEVNRHIAQFGLHIAFPAKEIQHDL